MFRPHRVFVIALVVVCAGCGARAPAPMAASEPETQQGEVRPSSPMRIGIPRELRPTEPPPQPSQPEQPTEPEPAEPAPTAPEPAAPEPAAPEPAAPEPAEPPASATPSAPTAGWDYLRDARRHVAHTYREQIQSCFNEGAARGPLSGRLVVAMVPHEDGRVASSRVIENGTADAELGECVVRAARGWELPPPPRRTLEVQLRFAI